MLRAWSVVPRVEEAPLNCLSSAVERELPPEFPALHSPGFLTKASSGSWRGMPVRASRTLPQQSCPCSCVPNLVEASAHFCPLQLRPLGPIFARSRCVRLGPG